MAEKSYVSTEIQAVTIAQSGTTTAAVTCTGGMILWKIIMPTGWDAANITFTESYDNSTFQAAYNDSGTLYTVSAAASRVLTVPPTWGIGSAGFFKVVATAAQASAARTLYLVLRAV